VNPESVLDDEDGGDEEENSTQNFDDNVTNESILKKSRAKITFLHSS
jgi:hypothetical protein